MCIEFVINNVSPQVNVKIKLNLKLEEICRDCSAKLHQRHIHNHVKHLIQNVSQK